MTICRYNEHKTKRFGDLSFTTIGWPNYAMIKHRRARATITHVACVVVQNHAIKYGRVCELDVG